jgi:hypothetical protein
MERRYRAWRSDWLLASLLASPQAFPTPAFIARLSMKEFVQQAWTVIGRKDSKQRLLEDIYRTAQSPVAKYPLLQRPSRRFARYAARKERATLTDASAPGEALT